MRSALQCARVEANLAEHPSDSFDVLGIAVVRAAGDCNLFCIEMKTVRSARCDERDGLKWFRRRAQVSDHFRRAELSYRTLVSVSDHDVAAIARFNDRATLD